MEVQYYGDHSDGVELFHSLLSGTAISVASHDAPIDSDYIVDQIAIYPDEELPFSKIEKLEFAGILPDKE